jgi:hypothetical protein
LDIGALLWELFAMKLNIYIALPSQTLDRWATFGVRIPSSTTLLSLRHTENTDCCLPFAACGVNLSVT